MKCTTLFALMLVLFSHYTGAQQQVNMSVDDGSAYHEQGRDIYNYRCYFCHGYSGNARTLTTSYIKPRPRDFSQTEISSLSREKMIRAVTQGKSNTAMTGFSRLLSTHEIEAVVDFVRIEFMQNKQQNTRYHTKANGWDNHQRYAIAFPFATGEIALDTPWETLNAEQIKGKQLFLTSCITCHDRAKVIDEGEIWKKQSISYPRNNYSHTRIDAISSASIYAKHDISPEVNGLSENAILGQSLWLENCAFCHGADGSGQNWIGSFLEPTPRDLRDPGFMSAINRDILQQRIEYGLKNTSMPAWKDVLTKNEIQQIISYISEAFYPLTN